MLRYDLFGEPQIPVLFGSFYPVNKYINQKNYTCNPWCYIKPFGKYFYDDNVTNISNFITSKIQNNTIYGIFSYYELNSLKSLTCFQQVNKSVVLQNILDEYYLVNFKPCN